MKTPTLFLTLVALPLAALAADVTGNWKSEFDSQIGFQKYAFTFKQDGTNLTGKASSEVGDRKREAELKEGKVVGDAVSFVEMVSFDGNEIRIAYTGKLSANGNEIKFTRAVGDFATTEIVAKRESAALATVTSAAKVIRINAGQTTPYTDANGNVWLPDEGFEGGATISRDPATPIDGTKDPDLFLTEHYSMESFSIKLPNGKYLAKHYFAETFEGILGPGDRVFSFNVQGREFKDFDIWKKAGGPNRAYIESVPVEITNGVFRITFTSQVENPAINAIEIIPQTATDKSTTDKPTLKQAYQNHFLIGAAVNRTIAMNAAVRADNVNRNPEQVGKDIALIKEQFNQITAENDMKWQLIHPREGKDSYDFAPADAFVNFGLSHDMYLVGHTLVWHSQTPNWVFAGTNPPPAAAGTTNAGGTNFAGGRRFGGGFGRYTGPRASREELLERMREHIYTVVGRYKGKIKSWDVVNEAIADGGTNVLRNSLWLEIIGPDYIAKAFQYAHEADPNAVLRYNDYGLESPAKRKKLISLIKDLQAQKVPVHAIGSQAHVNVSTSFETMDQALTEMAALGLPIHITELDVNSAQGGQRNISAEISANAAATQGGLVDDANRRQAEAYAGIFRAFVKHRDSVKMITFWGANDAVSWRAQGRPLLFDGNNQPKPAFDAVLAEASKSGPAK